MALQLVMFAMLICFLGKACILSRVALTLAIFLARGLIAGVFQAAYVYTPEVYPTHLRSTGVSTCSAMARIGAMIDHAVHSSSIFSVVYDWGNDNLRYNSIMCCDSYSCFTRCNKKSVVK